MINLRILKTSQPIFYRYCREKMDFDTLGGGERIETRPASDVRQCFYDYPANLLDPFKHAVTRYQSRINVIIKYKPSFIIEFPAH